MTCGAILARNAEHASLLHRHQLASHDGILWGGFSYLKTNLGASARETERVERPARGGNLRTLELRRVLLLLAGHVGSRSRFPAGEFLDKMSGKAGESRHHGQHGPLEARPAAGFAPAQCCRTWDARCSWGCKEAQKDRSVTTRAWRSLTVTTMWTACGPAVSDRREGRSASQSRWLIRAGYRFKKRMARPVCKGFCRGRRLIQVHHERDRRSR
jgi:hypothetical protein